MINWWLHQGYRNALVGLEIDHRVASHLRRRLRRFANVRIIEGDAIENLPANGTLYYMFNPFGRELVEALKTKLATRSDRAKLTLLYYSCRHVDVFMDDPTWQVEITSVGDRTFAAFPELAVIRFAALPSDRTGASAG